MENNAPATNNFLNWVEIKNFKSIKDLRLDCKRVNVFIGKPNVGKSNILEGLGLLGDFTHQPHFFEGSIRYQELKQLFYDSDPNEAISVQSINRFVTLNRKPDFGTGVSHFGFSINEIDKLYRLSEKGKLITVTPDDKTLPSFVRKYDYKDLTEFDGLDRDYLLPPNGSNLYAVVRRNKELWTEFAKLFAEQQLELVLYDAKQEFILQKKDGAYIWQYPFFSIADTFRRFMFYITAIESNKNSVIIFEEPEVHSFPPYTQDVAYRMIYSDANQFFVSTHSPYLLQTLVSNLGDDQLNVFVTYYEDYETKVKMLTPEEIGFVQEYSTDVFFNLDRFVPNAQSANPA